MLDNPHLARARAAGARPLQGRPLADPAVALAILGLALLARVVAAIILGNDFHFADEALYIDAAHRIASGHGFGAAYDRVPAYPIFLAALDFPLSANLVLIRCVHAAVAAVACLLTFILARRMFGRSAAVVASILVAIDPLIVISSGLLYPEAITAALVVPAIWLATTAAGRDRLAASAGLGLMLGIISLLRPVALVLPPVFAIWIVCTNRGAWSRRLLHVAAISIPLVLSLVPWTIRNYRLHDQVIPIATAGAGAAVDATTDRNVGRLVRTLATAALEDPARFAARTAGEFVRFWELYPTRLTIDRAEGRQELHRRDSRLPTEETLPRTWRNLVSALSFGVELSFALVGVYVGLRTRRKETLLLLAVILSYAVGYSLFMGKVRYRIPVLPLVFILAGVGFGPTFALLTNRWRSRELGATATRADACDDIR